MERMFSTVVLAGVAGLLLFAAPLGAVELKLGGSFGWQEDLIFYDSTGTDADMRDHYDSIRVSALADTRYFRFAGGYAYHVLDYVVATDGSEKDYGNRRIGVVCATALAKYPLFFSGGAVSVWPAVGIEYAKTVQYTVSGRDALDDRNAMSDVYGVIGGGADYALSDSLTATGSLLAGWNFTPDPSTRNSDTGRNYRAMNLVLSFGLLRRL